MQVISFAILASSVGTAYGYLTDKRACEADCDKRYPVVSYRMINGQRVYLSNDDHGGANYLRGCKTGCEMLSQKMYPKYQKLEAELAKSKAASQVPISISPTQNECPAGFRKMTKDECDKNIKHRPEYWKDPPPLHAEVINEKSSGHGCITMMDPQGWEWKLRLEMYERHGKEFGQPFPVPHVVWNDATGGENGWPMCMKVSELETLKAELAKFAAKETELEDAKAKFAAKETELSAQLTNVKHDLATTVKELTKANADLRVQDAKFTATVTELKGRLKDANAIFAAKETELTNTKHDLATTVKELATCEASSSNGQSSCKAKYKDPSYDYKEVCDSNVKECLDWTCDTWCKCYNPAHDEVYDILGCGDDGDDTCECA